MIKGLKKIWACFKLLWRTEFNFRGEHENEEADEAEAHLEHSKKVLVESLEAARAAAERQKVMARSDAARGRRVMRRYSETIDLARRNLQ